MSITAPQVPSVGKSATRMCSVSFEGKLDSGELLTGTPTVTEIGTSDLTLGNKAVSTGALTLNGATVATGQAVQFSATGFTAGRTYKIHLSCGTDATPAQTLTGVVSLKAMADGT